MKTVYMISGTMGVGKTTVCELLNEKLPNSVFLDGDWCWKASPFQVTDETKAMVIDNICYLLNNFIHCSAYDNIVFCWVMHEQSIINHITERLDMSECSIKNISLICDKKTLEEHLHKDISKGIRNPEILQRSLARLNMYTCLDTIKLDISGKTSKEIVAELVAM